MAPIGTSASGNIAHYARSWLEVESGPRIIVSRGLEILWSNSAADTLLSGRQGLAKRGARLLGPTSAANDSLEILLTDAEAGPSILSIARSGGEGWLLLRASRLEGPTSVVFGISITEASEHSRSTYEHLDTAFALTKAEHRVLLDLLDGNDAEALAAMHGVSVETTRSHIRSIYAKVGVRSRERLFARLQNFRA